MRPRVCENSYEKIGGMSAVGTSPAGRHCHRGLRTLNRRGRPARPRLTPLSIVGGVALLQRQNLAEMTTRRLMELIEVAAMRSGHPNVIFAVISLVVSALTILTLRSLIGWGAL
jgi:hypothetical protein